MTPRARATSRTGFLVFLVALSAYAATTGGSMATDIMSYEVTKGIVEHGTVAMSYDVYEMDAHRGVDGRYYAPYGIGHAVFAIPFYAVGRGVEAVAGSVAKPEVFRKAGFVMSSAVGSALTVWVMFSFALKLSADVRAAVFTALMVGFGTLVWPYAKFGFSAPIATLAVTWGTYGVWVGSREDRPAMLALGGAGFGSALLVKHELALLCLPVALWLWLDARGDIRLAVRRVLIVAVPVVAAVFATLLYNQLRFGNPFDTGYLRDDTVATGSWWDGLVGQLFSPGRSIFLYSPPLIAGVIALVALAARDRPTAVLLGAQFLTLLFFYASFTHWDAERSYGPRYLLPITPLLVLPLAPWLVRQAPVVARRLLTALLAASVLIQLPGVLVDFSKVGWSPDLPHYSWEARRWTWEASGLRLNALASLRSAPINLQYVTGAEAPPAMKGADGQARDFSEQFGFSFDFWWLYLFYLGLVGAPVALALGALSWLTTGVLTWQLRRSLEPV